MVSLILPSPTSPSPPITISPQPFPTLDILSSPLFYLFIVVGAEMAMELAAERARLESEFAAVRGTIEGEIGDHRHTHIFIHSYLPYIFISINLLALLS